MKWTYLAAAVIIGASLSIGLSHIEFGSFTKNQDIDCEKLSVPGESINCQMEDVRSLLSEHKVADALDTVAYLSNSEPSFQESCHAFMHEIGEEAYLLYAQSIPFELNENVSLCTFGFYHGFLETLIFRTGDYSEAARFCDFVNDRLRDSGLNPDTLAENCYHGIGHGTIDDHDPNQNPNPFDLSRETLSLCQKVSVTDKQYHDCGTGVFNGVANLYLTDDFGWKKEKYSPIELCEQQDDGIKKTCYAYIARVIFSTYNRDLAASLKAVDDLVDENYKANTVKNLATFYLYVSTTDERIIEAKQHCLTLPTRLSSECIAGLVAGVVQGSGANLNIDEIHHLCMDPSFQGNLRRTCFESAHKNVLTWYPAEVLRNFCSGIPDDHTYVCQ